MPEAERLPDDARLVRAGVYEGGDDEWECAADLASLLATTDKDNGDAAHVCVSGAAVLELGAGRGVPGVAALQAGAASVLFQELRACTLQRTTQRSVAQRCGAAALAQRASFVAGDWATLARHAEAGALGQFALVLAAECVYRLATLPAFVALLRAALARSPAAVALIATKTYYFGVGGGSLAFRSALDAANAAAPSEPPLVAECVQTIADGQSNVREILAVRWQLSANEPPCD